MKKNAFTLIELLVVISIIAILLALSVFGIQHARETSRDSRRKSDLEAIRSALELYRSDCGTYPGNLAQSGSLTGQASACIGNTYIQEIPQDPLPDRNYHYLSADGSMSYILCAALESSDSAAVNGCSCGATCNYRVTNP